MERGIWKSLFRPTNIQYTITIIFAIVAAIIGFFPGVDITIVVAAISLVLSSIAWLLFSAHLTMEKLRKRIPEKEPIIRRFRDWEEEMRKDIKEADAVWLLSRTGMGLMRRFEPEFRSLLSKEQQRRERNKTAEAGLEDEEWQNRFLFLDPRNDEMDKDHALRMIATTEIWNRPAPYRDFRRGVAGFYDFLPKVFGGLNLKTINYLPAWTLLIINPVIRGKSSVIYVELGSYRSDPTGRLTLRLETGHGFIYDRFLEEYRKMWQDATWWESHVPAGSEVAADEL